MKLIGILIFAISLIFTIAGIIGGGGASWAAVIFGALGMALGSALIKAS
ncbi:MAG: hypothetical protein IJT41_00030 [Clostridia bacterium]|nr:hypothetical protein [Clostridia bacterium]